MICEREGEGKIIPRFQVASVEMTLVSLTEWEKREVA